MSSRLPIPLQQSICQNYGCSVESVTPVGTGAMSTTMKLASNRGTLFLKIYKSAPHQQMTSERIAFTHAVHNFLYRNRCPVPRLLPNRAGETFRRCEAQIYALFEFIEGQDYEGSNPDHLRSSGEMLGLLHQRLQGFQPPLQPVWQPMETEVFAQLTDRLTRIRAVAETDDTPPVSLAQIERWLDEAEQLTDNCRRTVPLSRRWVIHGDYRAQNLKFDDGRIHAILDLDTARPANRLYDLGYALVFFPAVYQETPLTAAQQSLFLQAYESICPLSEMERKALPVHLRLAFLRGITLWLDLCYFAGMRERTLPWIRGYLYHMI